MQTNILHLIENKKEFGNIHLKKPTFIVHTLGHLKISTV